MTATVSRAIGSGDYPLARQFAQPVHYYLIGGISTLLVIVTYPFLGALLNLLGAQGETAQLATRFCQFFAIHSTSWVFMATSALLRSVGDGKRAMFVTPRRSLSLHRRSIPCSYLCFFGTDGAAIANIAHA